LSKITNVIVLGNFNRAAPRQRLLMKQRQKEAFKISVPVSGQFYFDLFNNLKYILIVLILKKYLKIAF
jgi:hypothetical protein